MPQSWEGVQQAGPPPPPSKGELLSAPPVCKSPSDMVLPPTAVCQPQHWTQKLPILHAYQACRGTPEVETVNNCVTVPLQACTARAEACHVLRTS